MADSEIKQFQKAYEEQAAMAKARQYEQQMGQLNVPAPNHERRLSRHMVIVAGNQQQAEQHCRSLSISPFDVTIASNVDRLRGLKAYDAVFVGTWYQRDDAVDILHRLEADIVAWKLQGDDDTRNEQAGGVLDPAMQGAMPLVLNNSPAIGRVIATAKMPAKMPWPASRDRSR